MVQKMIILRGFQRNSAMLFLYYNMEAKTLKTLCS
uniref:Uncharacterized protein n=1 Tax=Rhizophora mucronata TaxID=61149 RepID=A0A2P2QLZ4_RHIMU